MMTHIQHAERSGPVSRLAAFRAARGGNFAHGSRATAAPDSTTATRPPQHSTAPQALCGRHPKGARVALRDQSETEEQERGRRAYRPLVGMMDGAVRLSRVPRRQDAGSGRRTRRTRARHACWAPGTLPFAGDDDEVGERSTATAVTLPRPRSFRSAAFSRHPSPMASRTLWILASFAALGSRRNDRPKNLICVVDFDPNRLVGGWGWVPGLRNSRRGIRLPGHYRRLPRRHTREAMLVATVAAALVKVAAALATCQNGAMRG